MCLIAHHVRVFAPLRSISCPSFRISSSRDLTIGNAHSLDLQNGTNIKTGLSCLATRKCRMVYEFLLGTIFAGAFLMKTIFASNTQ